MAKWAVDLDVNIALSKYGFNGAASFEIVRFGLQKQFFLACTGIYLSIELSTSALVKHTIDVGSMKVYLTVG